MPSITPSTDKANLSSVFCFGFLTGIIYCSHYLLFENVNYHFSLKDHGHFLSSSHSIKVSKTQKSSDKLVLRVAEYKSPFQHSVLQRKKICYRCITRINFSHPLFKLPARDVLVSTDKGIFYNSTKEF